MLGRSFGNPLSILCMLQPRFCLFQYILYTLQTHLIHAMAMNDYLMLKKSKTSGGQKALFWFIRLIFQCVNMSTGMHCCIEMQFKSSQQQFFPCVNQHTVMSKYMDPNTYIIIINAHKMCTPFKTFTMVTIVSTNTIFNTIKLLL